MATHSSDAAVAPHNELPTLSFDYLQAARLSRGPLAELSDAEVEDAAVRYRKFLLLKARYPDQTVAPTELIDEVWHLHMLHPVAYAQDCQRIFGFLLDHKPGFGATEATRPALLQRFAQTTALWEAEFGEPYCVDGVRYHNVIVCADDDDEDSEEPAPDPAPPQVRRV
jgi:hypothetical protein